MNASYKILFFLFLLTSLLFHTVIFAQTQTQEVSSVHRVGTTAGQFLKIGAGARPIGLGGAYSALATDILSVYWNPAGLSRIVGSGEATFNHAEWLAETNYDFAAFSMNLGGMGSVAVHLISFSTPEEPVRTVDNPEGTGQTWDANMIAIGISYAKNLTDRFSIGLTGKYIQEKIFNVSARGAAFDMGILYNTPLRNVTLAAAVFNFGSRMRLDGRDLFFNEAPVNESGAVDAVPAKYRTEYYDLPLSLRLGLAWHVLRSEDVQIVAVVDGTQPNDNSEYLNSGVEIGFQNVIFLRGGYKALFLENSEQGFTFGAGLKYNIVGTDLKFDFGWADYGRLNNVKFVSVAIKY